MISFRDDYSEIGHPRLIEALRKISNEQNLTYGLDQYSTQAAQLIQQEIGQECAVHLVGSGTQANIINLSSILKSYESIIACDSSHIALHETGALEATGHKINTVPNKNGKLTIEEVEKVVKEHHFEHMVHPRVVFISQSTELGSLYQKSELLTISNYCKENNLYLYLDGARLGSALVSKDADFTLSDVASFVDIFYIGGTKNGGLLGEAVVIMNDNLKENYRFSLKQRGALLAKGSLLGIQFVEFFKDGLYIELAQHTDNMARELVTVLKTAGVQFKTLPQTNQIFPILPISLVEKLEKDFCFYRWGIEDENHVSIRMVTSWATRQEDIEAFAKALI